MRDIAERANVSIGTVSRVLNRHSDVDEQLRTRVESVARKLGYRLSDRTLGAVQTKARIVGLIHCNDFELNPGHSWLLLGVEQQCAAAGYYLLFAHFAYSADVMPGQLELPPVVRTPGLAECLILSGTIHENLLAAFDRNGLKYVLLGNQFVGAEKNGKNRCSVEYDDERGCYDAMRYLTQLGHQQIWYIGDAARPTHRKRLAGYMRAVTELGLEPHVHTVALSDDEFENGQAAVSFITEQGWPMTAIVAASNELAYGVREGLRHHRREVPRDVSLVGFEKTSGNSRGSNLTSVSVDMAEVGRQLARVAIAQIEGRTTDAVVVPAVLVKRSTCRPLRKEEQMML
jgi:DNA-binding LacI/PurR family transcriptional regulator